MFPGEVYVLNDGGEVDLDLGNYERYLDVTLSRDNNITTGKIYREVIEKEVFCTLLLSIATTDDHPSEKENTWARRSRYVVILRMLLPSVQHAFRSFPTSPTRFKSG